MQISSTETTPRNRPWLLQLVTMGIVCDTYDYWNDTLGIRGTLWHCNGEVMFQSFGEATEWHGTLVHNHGGWPGNIFISFSYRGVRPFKATYLLPELPGRWVGRDYACRRITLTALDRFVWNRTTETWQLMPVAA